MHKVNQYVSPKQSFKPNIKSSVLSSTSSKQRHLKNILNRSEEIITKDYQSSEYSPTQEKYFVHLQKTNLPQHESINEYDPPDIINSMIKTKTQEYPLNLQTQGTALIDGTHDELDSKPPNYVIKTKIAHQKSSLIESMKTEQLYVEDQRKGISNVQQFGSSGNMNSMNSPQDEVHLSQRMENMKDNLIKELKTD